MASQQEQPTTEKEQLSEDAAAAEEALRAQKEAAAKQQIPLPAEWPAWAHPIPEGMPVPRGRTVYPIRFRADWTDTPHLGERQLVLWSLTPGDEKLAYDRARGDQLRSVAELAKQMIRSIDGKEANFNAAGEASIPMFWQQIGAKCRSLIIKLYIRTHVLSQEDQDDFFENCVGAFSAS